MTQSTEPRDTALEILYESVQRPMTEPAAALGGKAKRLVAGVIAHIDELDDAIDDASDHWRIDRMPLVDLTVLRIGVYELRYERDTPTAVVLSEAVRMAKTYSTAKSGPFVNGLLAAIAGRERPDDPGTR